MSGVDGDPEIMVAIGIRPFPCRLSLFTGLMLAGVAGCEWSSAIQPLTPASFEVHLLEPIPLSLNPGMIVPVRIRVTSREGIPLAHTPIRISAPESEKPEYVYEIHRVYFPPPTEDWYPYRNGRDSPADSVFTNSRGELEFFVRLGDEKGMQTVEIRRSGSYNEMGVTLPIEVVGEEAGTVFETIAIGRRHACALASGGRAYCWGSGGDGMLGIGFDFFQDRPARVEGGHRFVSLTMGDGGSHPEIGGGHSCGLTASGSAYCWGANHYRQLGSTGEGNAFSPVPVAGGLSFTSLSAGAFHTCGLTDEGLAYCWGRGDDGQLGTGRSSNEPVPVPVAGELSFAELAAGFAHTCGITQEEGAAYCWGSNAQGQLGTGDDGGRNEWIPTPVAGGIGFRTISTEQDYTCGVSLEGTGYCWGHQLMGGPSVPVVFSPEVVGEGLVFERITVGARHNCGIGTGGEGYCWGANNNNEVGVRGGGGAILWGHREEHPTPLDLQRAFNIPPLEGAESWVLLQPGGGRSCGLTRTHTLYCWGAPVSGGLGIGPSVRPSTLESTVGQVRVP